MISFDRMRRSRWLVSGLVLISSAWQQVALRATRSAARVVLLRPLRIQALPDPGEVGQVPVVQPVEEQPAQLGVVGAPRLAQQGAAGACEHDDVTAPVIAGAPTLHQTALLQPVGETAKHA